jgi:mRNA interferase MazF
LSARRESRVVSADAHRGDVWLIDFGDPVGREQSGRRPAVVVSADPLNESRAGVVIVVPCTTTRRGLPSHIEIEPGRSGLDEVSYAKCEDVKSVSEQRLVTRLGSVVDETLFAIARALRFLLDL